MEKVIISLNEDLSSILEQYREDRISDCGEGQSKEFYQEADLNTLTANLIYWYGLKNKKTD